MLIKRIEGIVNLIRIWSIDLEIQERQGHRSITYKHIF